jgi:adenylosuccinate lyase
VRTHARVDVARIEQLEAEFDHDMIAFVVQIQEALRAAGAGRWSSEFHKWMTSYDTEDPAAVLRLRHAVSLVIEALRELRAALYEQAKTHQWTLMMMRTHGQDAEPSTLGHLLLVFAFAVQRSVRRLERALDDELREAKMSGAVGTYAGADVEREALALDTLGLVPAVAETQILQRDRHAVVLNHLAVAAGSIEQMARTCWEMMRSDCRWLEEPRRSRQRGSSAMPHKKNPILTERQLGLGRLIRGYAHMAVENIATPEGRDISQSCVERVIFSDATAYVHYLASKAANSIRRLVVFPERMARYVHEGSFGVWAGQRVRNALVDRGVPYDRAYEYVQAASFEAVQRGVHLRRVLRTMRLSPRSRRTGTEVIGTAALRQCFDALGYIRPGVTHIFQRAEAVLQ